MAWKLNNKEKSAAHNRAWRESHKEERKAYMVEYAKANRKGEYAEAQ